jgi:Ca2+-binding RTX toxin-like protein
LVGLGVLLATSAPAGAATVGVGDSSVFSLLEVRADVTTDVNKYFETFVNGILPMRTTIDGSEGPNAAMVTEESGPLVLLTTSLPGLPSGCAYRGSVARARCSWTTPRGGTRVEGSNSGDRIDVRWPFGTGSVFAYGGADTINLAVSDDPRPFALLAGVDGGTGDDMITVVHLSPNAGIVVYGREGNDHLVGGPGRDSLNGGPGNDVVDAADGDNLDFVCDDGVDVIHADPGDRVAPCGS